MKVDILAIGVHPDDVELSCSGTLLKHIAAGKKVALLDLTRGELGTRGSAAIREKEATESARLMGVLARENLGMKDGFFAHSEENIRKIIPVIRKYQPEIVLANAHQDRHPDHGRSAKLVADACFLSGLVKIETSLDGKIQESWRPRAIYHYIQDQYEVPDFVVDITPFYKQKMELIMTFRSQFYNPDSKEASSPISGKDFIDMLEGKDRVFGRPIGVEYAEGFKVNRPVGIGTLFDLR